MNKDKCLSCGPDKECACDVNGADKEIDKDISLEEKLAKCELERQEYLDGWQRSKADFVNARREDEKLRLELVKYAKADLVIELLGVVDNFDRAFANKEVWEKVDKNWRIGVEYIYSQLMEILKNNGVTEVGKVGEKFDATIHQSVDAKESADETLDDTVAEITFKGFMLNGRIIRPAKVVIWHLKK